LKLDPDWRLVYDDGAALFFERLGGASIPARRLPAGLPEPDAVEVAKN
jgi:hypothetical protein